MYVIVTCKHPTQLFSLQEPLSLPREFCFYLGVFCYYPGLASTHTQNPLTSALFLSNHLPSLPIKITSHLSVRDLDEKCPSKKRFGYLLERLSFWVSGMESPLIFLYTKKKRKNTNYKIYDWIVPFINWIKLHIFKNLKIT